MWVECMAVVVWVVYMVPDEWGACGDRCMCVWSRIGVWVWSA